MAVWFAKVMGTTLFLWCESEVKLSLIESENESESESESQSERESERESESDSESESESDDGVCEPGPSSAKKWCSTRSGQNATCLLAIAESQP